MSDRDLRNLYDNIRENRGYNAPKRMNELYNDVISEATVTIDYGNGNVQTLQNVPNDKARQILTLKDIDDNTELLRTWVETGGWGETAQKVLVFRLSDIYRKHLDFDNSGIRDEFYQEVQTMVELKKNKRQLNNLKNLILGRGAGKTFNNCIDEINRSYGFKYITNQNALAEIAQITFEEGSVGVGPGEAIFTLFTEGINPEKGDLMLDGKEVELKGGKGRPGKGKTYQALKAFQDNISEEQIGASNFDENLINKCYQLLNSTELHNTIQDKTTGNPVRTELTHQQQSMIDAIKQYINDKKLEFSKKLNLIIGKLSLKTIQPLLVDLTVDGVNVLQILQQQKAELKSFSGKEAVQNRTFFDNADDATLAEKLLLMIVGESNRKAMSKILPSFIMNFRSQNRLIIGSAVQIANYYFEQAGKKDGSFEYYVLFNKVSMDVLTIGPFSGKSYVDVFYMCANALTSTASIGISPSTGGRGGWNITLGPPTDEDDE